MVIRGQTAAHVYGPTGPQNRAQRRDIQRKAGKFKKKKGRRFIDDNGFLQFDNVEGEGDDDDDDDDVDFMNQDNPYNPYMNEGDDYNNNDVDHEFEATEAREAKRLRKVAEIKFKPALEFIHKTTEKAEQTLREGKPFQFYQLHSDYHTDNWKPVLRFYGCDAEKNTVSVHLHDFKPYFYVDAERFDGDITRFRTFLNQRAKTLPTREGDKERDISKWRLDISVRAGVIPIKKYQTAKRRVFKIVTSLPSQISTLKRALEDETTKKTCPPKWDPVQTYESNIPFVLRYMTDQKIKGSTWVELSNYKVREGDAKSTTCNVELDIYYKDLVQLKQSGEYTMPPKFRIVSYDIECKGRGGHFPQASDDPVITIACVMVECGNEVADRKKFEVRGDATRVIFQLRGCNPIPGAVVYQFNDEKELLNAWRDWMISSDADLWAGHNHTQFDMPYLMNRSKTLKILERFSMLGRVIGEQSKCVEHNTGSKQRGNRKVEKVDVRGRTYFDTCLVFKTDFKLSSYALNSLSAKFLNDRKDDVHHSKIAGLYDGDATTRERLARYCLKDCLLPIQLIAKQNLLFSALLLSRVTGVPLSYVYERGQTIRIVMQILAKIQTTDYIIPAELTKEIEKIVGAHVFDPIAGYYGPTQPIATLDWASLYPSIMIAHNLCYTTITDVAGILENGLDMDKDITTTYIQEDVGGEEDVNNPKINPDSSDNTPQAKKKPRAPRVECGKKIQQSNGLGNYFETVSKKRAREDDHDEEITTTLGSSKKSKNGYNTHFVKPHVRVGILPQILREILAERKEAKRMMARHAEDGEEPDELLYLIYNLLQTVLKICANSIYGFTGAFAGPLPCPRIASTVTARGRDMIQKCADFVRNHYPGSKVVYGDTDSIMVLFCVNGVMVDNVRDAMITGKTAAKDITKWFHEIDVIANDPRELTFEKIFSPFLLYKKKKYAGQKWMEPKNMDMELKPKDELHIAGLECGRRDFPAITRDTMSICLGYILKSNDIASAELYVKNQVKTLYRNRMDMLKLVITRNFAKKIQDYKGPQPHISLLKKQMKRDPNFEPVLGDRIPYVMVEQSKVKNITYNKKGDKVMKKPGACDQTEDPIYAIDNQIPIDVDYYIERLLKKPLQKVFLIK